jgi:hypothetical protein
MQHAIEVSVIVLGALAGVGVALGGLVVHLGGLVDGDLVAGGVVAVVLGLVLLGLFLLLRAGESTATETAALTQGLVTSAGKATRPEPRVATREAPGRHAIRLSAQRGRATTRQ